MSNDKDYRQQIFQEYSILIDFEGLPDHSKVPHAVGSETFGQWQSRVLGKNIRNLRVYMPSVPDHDCQLTTLKVTLPVTFSFCSVDTDAIENIRAKIEPYLLELEIQKDDLMSKFEALCSEKMVEGSHGFKDYPGLTIGEAAKEQALRFSQYEDRTGAHILMDVVLAANRNYEKAVKDNIQRVKDRYPNLTLPELARLIEENDFRDFKKIWGHADEKKYKTLKSMVDVLLNLYPAMDFDDIGRMRQWAFDAKIEQRNSDPIGRLKNVGVATFQHLRLALGVDTVKPDQRVMEVLIQKFGAPSNIGEIGAVLAVEKLSLLFGVKPRFIDQVFVKYGSGHNQKKRKII